MKMKMCLMTVQETGRYEDVCSTARHNALPTYSSGKKTKKKRQVKTVDRDSNAPDSSELVDNVIYVSSESQD